jgi:hypothetical protein
MAEKTVGKTVGRATRGPAGKPAGPDPAGKADPGPARTPADTAARNTEKLEPEPLVVIEGLEKVAPAWWAAVGRVYDALLDDDADLDTVSAAFHEELVARFQYAKALHEQGYRVPDYLAERAPISPLWPLPEVPTLVRQATKAA